MLQGRCPRAPSIQIVPTSGSKIYKWYLLWAIWSPRVGSCWGTRGAGVSERVVD